MKILITGSQGFIGSYICNDLLQNNYHVIGVDNYSKYGMIKRTHDEHLNFRLYREDIASDALYFNDLVAYEKPDIIIANAAMIGGISYFHKYPYKLLAVNERILANTFDACRSLGNETLKRIIVMSSSMVYENATVFPSPEEHIKHCPPPCSTYGMQKLMCEYFALGAYQEFGLPYTIVRPFNCVGIGEEDKFQSHVLPDFVRKAIEKETPFGILGDGSQVRCFTHGEDIARAIRCCIENPKAENETFNISSSSSMTMLDLAKQVWKVVNSNASFEYKCLPSFEWDVKYRVPDVNKAKNLLDFVAIIPIQSAIEELVQLYQKK